MAAAWLSGFNKRIKLTADNTKIDSDLTQFPLTIFLKSGNGDTTKVFDEVGANKLKIAVTESDGTTQLYVEIEQWDDTNQVGVLHAGLSGDTLSSTADTDYYLYYDNTADDNTTYVGDTPGSSPVTNVWDSDFKVVYHMKDYPDTSHVADSTSTGNNGTKDSAGNPAEADAKIAKGQQFSSDSIISGSAIGISGAAARTIEAVVKNDNDTDRQAICGWGDFSTDEESVISQMDSDSRLYFIGYGDDLSSDPAYIIGDNAWHYVAFTFDGTTGKLYADEAQRASGSLSLNTTDSSLWVGKENHSGYEFYYGGIIDEVRISTVDRSAAWMKATNNSLFDTLLTYGTEETPPTNYTLTLSETLGLSEIFGKSTNFLKTNTDEIGLSDIIERSTNFLKTITDEVGLSDVIGIVRGFTKTISDTLGLSDTIQKTTNFTKTLSETLGLSDIAEKLTHFKKILTQNITLSDIATTGQKFIVVITETLHLSDITTRVRGFIKALTDSVGLNDIVAKSVGFKKTLSDSIGLSDVISSLKGFILTITETINLSDIVSKSMKLSKTILETLHITDIVSIGGGWFREIKHSSLWTKGSKHSSLWADETKHSSSWTNETKHK